MKCLLFTPENKYAPGISRASFFLFLWSWNLVTGQFGELRANTIRTVSNAAVGDEVSRKS